MDKKLFEKGRTYLKKADPIMRKVIEENEISLITKSNNYFQVLCESIVSQQLAAKAAQAICRRFLEYFQEELTPLKIEQSSLEELRALGLSQAKVRYIKDLAICCLTGRVHLGQIDKLSDQEVIQELTMVKGIGKWTAEIFLIFGMGRMDILPVDDLGIKKALQLHYSLDELPTPGLVGEKGETWKPYRTIAALYLWKSLNNQ